MSRITVSLAAVFVITLFELSFMLNSARAEDVFSEINEMLSSNKDNDGKVAMLAELSRPSLSQAEQNFLSKFIKLDQLRVKPGESAPCDRRGHEILRNTYELLRSRAGPTEMDRVLDEYAVEHANACLPKYAKEFEKLMRRDEITLRHVKEFESVKEFFHKIVRRRTDGPRTNYRVSDRWDLRFREIGNEGDAQDAHQVLVKYAIDNRHPYLRYLFGYIDEQKVTYREQVHKIYEQALLEPCKSYIQKFGPDFFAPAQFDLMTLEGPKNFLDETRNNKLFNYDHKPFLYALRDYQLCNALLRNRDELMVSENFFDKIMSVVAKATP